MKRMKRGNLRENYKKEHGEDAVRGKQAHHVIPVEILKTVYNCDEEELSEEFNGTWNCLMLPANQSEEFGHWGSHPWYTKFIWDQLGGPEERNIPLETVMSVAAAVRIFCEENMEPFIKMKLDGRINDIEGYVRIVHFVYNA